MYDLPNELSRKIWSYLYPIDKITNSNINNIEIGTSVNNIYNKINYCKQCGEIVEMNKCIHCNVIKYTECNKCRIVSINYDICCVHDYNKFLL
jgi:hypothetical protein